MAFFSDRAEIPGDRVGRNRMQDLSTIHLSTKRSRGGGVQSCALIGWSIRTDALIKVEHPLPVIVQAADQIFVFLVLEHVFDRAALVDHALLRLLTPSPDEQYRNQDA